ncbi:CubicO group peptidase (beta-lactamase class C family) [Nakamurella sp. UYEF19]|uniref:serine hydrolase domain-containing protein n=1 Tax=Nakamurella sp. UYEF19 TaxID=1756392 RepID=UPI003397AAC5
MTAGPGTSRMHGYCATGWEGVRDALARDDSGTEIGGVSLAVHHRGQVVVDLWGGRDPIDGQDWTRDSVGTLFSCTKAITSVILLRLVDQGLVDLESPVAAYWPEFAAAGKGAITIRQVMSHLGGLPFVGTTDLTTLYDQRASAALLAAATPVYPPGDHWMYHALSVGYLDAEVVRRVTGRTVGTILQQEISGPRSLDLWIGLPADRDGDFRPSHPVVPADLSLLDGEPTDALEFAALRTAREVVSLMVAGEGASGAAEAMITRAFRAAEIPAANGTANARGLAGFYAALIDRTQPLLSPALLRRATRSQTDLTAPVPPEQVPHRYGIGLDLRNPNNPMLGDGCFGHSGAGGRLGFCWPDEDLAFGYVPTTMGLGEPDLRWAPILDAVASSVRAAG